MKIEVHRKDTSIESISIKGLTISLIAAGDGTEIISHKLNQGSRWAIAPEDGWEALEYVYVISGSLLWKTEQGDIEIKAGDSISAHLITETALFEAVENAEFLYIVSRPFFHNYSQTNQELMSLAVSIEEKDGYTSDHCERIKHYSVLIGEQLKLSSYDLYILNLAAYLHDVGKVRIPEAILNKPDKLTDDEFREMKKHTTYGKELLYERGNPDLRIVGDIIEQHHERYDGKGYPLGLSGEAISKLAAIITVADSYDAMTVDRVYQKARTKTEALEEIKRCSGTLYHPEIVEAFLHVMGEVKT